MWRAALNELAQVLTIENFNAWLASTRVIGQDGKLLRVAVPKEFNKNWLENKLHGSVMNTLGRLDYERLGIDGMHVERVEYIVERVA